MKHGYNENSPLTPFIGNRPIQRVKAEESGPRDSRPFFMLNSAEHEIYPTNKS